jgi:hypothetical protein
MSNFKPQASYISDESIRDYRNGYSKSELIYKRFKTYVELKRNLKTMLEESFNDVVSVSRSRRGEWGEWFEKWELINGKPKITNQGWM